MWSGFVSMLDAAMERAIFRFIEIIWRYPAIGAAFLTAFLVLSSLLWIEVLKDGAGRRSEHAKRAAASAGPTITRQ